MKLREFINTNQNELEEIYIYLDENQWDNGTPEIAVRNIRDIPDVKSVMSMYVDAWYVDVNFNLHVLI